MPKEITSGHLMARRGIDVKFMIMMPILGVMISAFVAWDLLLFAVSTSPALNLVIIILTSFGALMALLRAVEIDRDRALIWSLDSLSAPGGDPPDIGHQKSAVSQALKVIRRSAENEGQKAFQAAVSRESDLLRGALQQRLAILQYLASSLISLGLLGTFLGLLQTLISSAAILDAASASSVDASGGDSTAKFASMISALKIPLAHMGTAFSASLLGLLGSMIVGIMVIILQRNNYQNVTAFRNQVMGAQSKLFSFKQDETVDASVVQDILAAMLERERLAQRRSDQVLAAIREGMEAFSNTSARIDGIGAAVERLAANLSDLPVWCAENHDIVAQLRSSGAVLERLSERAVGIETMLTRIEANGKGVLDSLATVQGQMVEQAEHNRSFETSLNSMVSRLDGLAGQADALTGALSHHTRTAEAVASTVRGIADHLEPMREQSGLLTETVSRLAETTDRMIIQSEEAWTSLEGSLSAAQRAQADQQMALNQSIGLLDVMNGLLTAALEHLTQMSAALPTQQGQIQRLEQRLEPLQNIDQLVQEQLNTLLQLVGQLSRIEGLYETSRSNLWELIAGQTSQVQLMTGMLDEQRAQSERESALTVTAERLLESMLRLEVSLERLPKASLLVEHSNAATTRLLAISEQIGGLAQAQNELRTEAFRASGMMQNAVVENRSQETQRVEAFRQIYISMAKLSDLLESRFNSERSQERNFAEARGMTGNSQDSLRSGATFIQEVDLALDEGGTDRKTETSPARADGSVKKRIRGLAKSLKLLKGDD